MKIAPGFGNRTPDKTFDGANDSSPMGACSLAGVMQESFIYQLNDSEISSGLPSFTKSKSDCHKALSRGLLIKEQMS